MTPRSETFDWPDRLMAAARVDAGTLYYVGLGVVVAIVVVTLVVFYRTWTEINEDYEPDSPEDLLDSFREAHSAGQIDDRELERVQRLLGAGEAIDNPRSAGRDHPQSRDRPKDSAQSEGPELFAP